MILHEEYFDDVKEYIKAMNEKEFTKRGTTKKEFLENQDIMENIWCAHQKNVEEYGYDKAFSLQDAVKEVLSVFPSKASALYRCPFCGSERFIGHQVIRADVYVDESGEFDGNLPSGLEASTYDSSAPYGPFTCVKCSQEFDELPGNKQVKLTGGIFTVVSDEMVQKFKEIGYGYSHEENGYIVVNDGKRAVAVSNYDSDHYYDGQKTVMM